MIIDVRSQEAYKSGHIVNARNIAIAELEASKELAKKPRNKTLLVVCDDGARSGKAATVLRCAGFEIAFILMGVLLRWLSESLPLIK